MITLWKRVTQSFEQQVEQHHQRGIQLRDDIATAIYNQHQVVDAAITRIGQLKALHATLPNPNTQS